MLFVRYSFNGRGGPPLALSLKWTFSPLLSKYWVSIPQTNTINLQLSQISPDKAGNIPALSDTQQLEVNTSELSKATCSRTVSFYLHPKAPEAHNLKD